MSNYKPLLALLFTISAQYIHTDVIFN